MYIYLIQNTVNGKIYIGKTTNKSLKRYICVKLCGAARGVIRNPYLARAVQKYGKQNFKVIPLISGIDDEEVLSANEIHLIKLFDSRNRAVGYNLTSGGEGRPGLPAWNRNIPIKPEVAEKVRTSVNEFYATHPGPNKGKPMSEEQKIKIRETMRLRGIQPSTDACRKGGAAVTGEPKRRWGNKNGLKIKPLVLK